MATTTSSTSGDRHASSSYRQTRSLLKPARFVDSSLLLILLLLTNAIYAQNDKIALTLELGKPVERELAGGQSHSYWIKLTSGQYAHIVVDQRGIDVVMTLLGPDGTQIIEVDSPNGTEGFESASIIAETSGTYRLEVRSLEKDIPAGRYEARVKDLRVATENDRRFIAAEKLFQEGRQLFDKGTKEALKAAIRKFTQALPLYHSLIDHSKEAETLSYISYIYSTLGEKQKALDYYKQALPLRRAIKNRTGEAETLNNIGSVYDDLGEQQKALDYYKQALPLRRAIKDRLGEAATLNNVGKLYFDLGGRQKALDHYRQALSLFLAVGDRSGRAITLSNIGLVYSTLGEKQKALDYYGQALPLNRAAGDRTGEAATLNNIGGVYADLGENQKALDHYNHALSIYLAVGDRRSEAQTLNNIGLVYSSLGEKQKALDYYKQALPLRRSLKDPTGEAITLNSMGKIYDDLGEKQKALDFYEQALSLDRATGGRKGEATSLNNVAAVYSDLGEKQKALDFYEQALSVIHVVGDPAGEAAMLTSIGKIYDDLGQQQKALDYYKQALPLRRAIKNRTGEAITLNNIGKVYNSLGEKQKALEYYGQALLLFRAVGNRRDEGRTLNNIGVVYNSIGEKQKALDYYGQALPLSRASADRNGEAITLSHLMSLYQSLNNTRLAIFYGKQSVNIYQQLRSNIHGLEIDIQKTYLKSVEQIYRGLAVLLIAQSRNAEAQQVLNAFKDQQFFDFDTTPSRLKKPLAYTPREEGFEIRFDKILSDIGVIDTQIAELKRKAATRQPIDEEGRRLQNLEAQRNNISNKFSALLKQTEAEFSRPVGDKDKVFEIPDTTEMQTILRQINQESGQEVVAVYTLVGQDHYYALLVTDNSITSVSSIIKGDELNGKARHLWALLQSTNYDPRILSNELYNIIFKPIETNLPKDTKTIIWSLDGNLRYLPMAALYDSKRYLVERYNHVVFTRAEKERLTRAVSQNWTGYGFATSEPHTVRFPGSSIEFNRLDSSKEEMQIFRTKSYPVGIIDGDVLAEAHFTKASMLAMLKQQRPVVHISSHFRFRPGDATSSFLLLGDGHVMTIAEMREYTNLFQGVELLTLSACDTAAQRPDATGREIDGMAELAQRLGAGGVMASLWAVSDKSTAQLMKRFYTNYLLEKSNKAAALRKAQLDLLYGSTQNLVPSTDKAYETFHRGGSTDDDILVEKKYRIPFEIDKKKPFAHPYYWSPFVLFGNWK